MLSGSVRKLQAAFALTLACALLPACGSSRGTTSRQAPSARRPSASHPCGQDQSKRTYRHVIWIWEENHSYDQIIGSANAPYINQLASKCGLATNYHNVEHESLTNYLAALAGQIADNPRITGVDCLNTDCPQPADNLLHQLEMASPALTWKVYAESMTSNCQGGENTELYATRHAPGPYFTDVAAGCAVNDVPMTDDPGGGPTASPGNFLTDLQKNTLPNFSFIGPNLCDDGHYIIPSVPYCTPAVASRGSAIPAGPSSAPIETDASLPQRIKVTDQWLAAWIPAIIASPAYRSGDTIVYITWDEGETADYALAEPCWDQTHSNVTTYPSCHVPLIAISPHVAAGSHPSVSLNHLNLLQATEQNFGLPLLPMSPATGGVATPNSLRAAFGS